MNLYSGKIGSEGTVSIDMAQGVISVKAEENTPGIKVKLEADMPLTYYVDAGAEKLNSPIVKAIAGLLDGILKQLP